MQEITLTYGLRTSTAKVHEDSVLCMLARHSKIVDDEWAIDVMEFMAKRINFEDFDYGDQIILLEKIIYYNVVPDLEDRIEYRFDNINMSVDRDSVVLYGEFESCLRAELYKDFANMEISMNHDAMIEHIQGQAFPVRMVKNDDCYSLDDDDILVCEPDDIEKYCVENMFIISDCEIYDNSFQVGKYYIYISNPENHIYDWKYPEFSESAETLGSLISEFSWRERNKLMSWKPEITVNELIVMSTIRYHNGNLQVEIKSATPYGMNPSAGEQMAQEYLAVYPEILELIVSIIENGA